MKKFFLILSLLLIQNCFADYSYTINNRNINYNTDTLKFYENSILMSESELQSLYPDYEIVLISQFDKNRKYTVKNSSFQSKKILLLNDTTRTFHRFYIYPESSRFKPMPEVKSLITIYGKKNVRLKHEGGDEFEIVVK